MERSIFIATYEPEDSEDMLDLKKRIAAVGVSIEYWKERDSAFGFKIIWDDSTPVSTKGGGMQKKAMQSDTGEILTCGMVYKRKQNGFTDEQIAREYNSNGSTFKRRKKEHTDAGEIYEDSEIIF